MNNTDANYPKTLTEAVRYFSDPDTALSFFVSIRWPEGVTCPHCGSKEVSYLANQRRWQCRTKHPRRQFSAKVGTIFEDSPLSLEQWMVGVWLEVNAKNSISSYEVHRALGITQKSAWFMQHRIRLAMQSGNFSPMGGEGSNGVEADETYVGGLARNMHKAKRQARVTGTGAFGSGKTAVMGLLERHSDKSHSTVRATVLRDVRRPTIQEVIRKNVAAGSPLYTDALHAYTGMSEYIHQFIDHAEKYVEGMVHTNGLENFWSLLKRCIKGTHVSVEPFHLLRYVDAECFRFNHRKLNDGQRFVGVLRGTSGKRITYDQLTGKDDSVISDKGGENAVN